LATDGGPAADSLSCDVAAGDLRRVVVVPEWSSCSALDIDADVGIYRAFGIAAGGRSDADGAPKVNEFAPGVRVAHETTTNKPSGETPTVVGLIVSAATSAKALRPESLGRRRRNCSMT
jgi:hypothetical protein